MQPASMLGKETPITGWPLKVPVRPPAAATPWNISSRPCSVGESEAATVSSLARSSIQYGGQTLDLCIKPSIEWDSADLSQLETLIQSRNKFVCFQLVTMAKEQYAKVQQATVDGDAATLHFARFTFMGKLLVQGIQHVVAAALFYPRTSSKDGVYMPHMYIELLCCNSPGNGYGTVLLQHLEQFVACAGGYLSAGFVNSPNTQAQLSSASSSSSSQDSEAITGNDQSITPKLLGIKLLSVASAQRFYAKNGYGEPDACREMFKPLMLSDAWIAGNAASSNASDCGSSNNVAYMIC
eukprot:GHRR01003944.1.p1 GENE.GHRR01003944.1~~GHRR01003944.1.p1  ORF type:complete len:296 (+),score=101.33 GHRR01003944.1:614-1501(+)